MEDLELYIEVDADGNPVNHPILGDNFRSAFPHIDTNNLPSKYEKFIRVAKPQSSEGETVSDQPEYQRINGILQDVWVVTKKNV
jgi:hypothetical protein